MATPTNQPSQGYRIISDSPPDGSDFAAALGERLLTSMTESPANFGSWFMTELAIFPQPWPIQGIIEADLLSRRIMR
jgi:hypothetical protein